MVNPWVGFQVNWKWSFAKRFQLYYPIAFSADIPITCTLVSVICAGCTLLERMSCGLKTVTPARCLLGTKTGLSASLSSLVSVPLKAGKCFLTPLWLQLLIHATFVIQNTKLCEISTRSSKISLMGLTLWKIVWNTCFGVYTGLTLLEYWSSFQPISHIWMYTSPCLCTFEQRLSTNINVNIGAVCSADQYYTSVS